ncbi:MAG TPA: helix-turn-helix domain-containing protein [Candidatus Angelobacter sp.]|jgi:sugar diacid utilization regulator|nr:helix-turn-helix domain-containing protein [Candidatus Angelobacter sp.]
MRLPSSDRTVEAAEGRTAGLRELVELSWSSAFVQDDEQRILAAVVERLPALGGVVLERAFLVRDRLLVGWPAGAERPDDTSLITQLTALHGRSGAVKAGGGRRLTAHALRSPAGLAGYLVVTADREPREAQRFLLRGLVALTGLAVGAALTQRRAQDDGERIRWLVERVDEATAELAGFARVSETLARTGSEDGGVQGIAAALHELTGRSVIVEDRLGARTAAAGPDPGDAHVKPSPSRLAWRSEQIEQGRRPVRDGDLLVAPAAPYGEVLGALAMVDAQHSATAYDLFALEQAATLLAIELAHRQRVLDAHLAMERDFLDDLLSGLDDAAAVARGDSLGHDVSGTRCVVVARWQDDRGDALQRALERVAEGLGLDALFSRRDGAAVAMLDATAWWGDHGRWDDLHARIAALLGAPSLAMGVGGLARGPAQLPRAHREAMQALAVRTSSRNPHGITRFDDLGVYRILARGESRDDIEQFVAEWLGKLIDYDAAHTTDMVPTLAEYCESAGNYDRTAHTLGIHRSTLRYRLHRIRELSGRDLNDVDARFNLHVATRAWRLLRSGD